MITARVAPRPDRRQGADRTRPQLAVVASDPDGGERPRRRSARGVVSTLLVVLLFASIFGVVVFQVFLIQAQSQLDLLDHQIAVQEQLSKQLRLDTADLESPQRIMRDGDRLGMIPPNDIGYLQSKVDDDANATFDPTKETLPVPSTVAPTATVPTWTPPAQPTPTWTAPTSTPSWTPPATVPPTTRAPATRAPATPPTTKATPNPSVTSTMNNSTSR